MKVKYQNFLSKKLHGIDFLKIKIVLYVILSKFWIVASVWVLFLTSKGYTLDQIALLDSSYFLAIFIFEIPTGMIADKMGRKFSIILSMIFKALGILWLAIAPGPFQIFLAFMIWGIGMTMSSGAEEAWLYDEVKNVSEDNEGDDYYQKIFGIMTGIGLISTAIANISGGFLFEYSIQLPLILTSVVFSIAVMILITIPENRSKSNYDQELQDNSTKIAFSVLRKPKLIILTLITVSIGSLISSMIYWMQPYLVAEGLSTGDMGIVLGLGVVFASLGSGLNTRLMEQLKHYTLPFIIVIFALSFLFIPLFGIVSIILLFIVIRLFRGAYNPVFSSLINTEFDNSYRATALSIISGATTLGIVFTLWISGLIIERISFSTYFLTSSLILFMLIFPLSMFYTYKYI